MSRIVAGALIALGCAGGYAQSQDATPPEPPSNEQLAAAKCVSGMEKFLPGEYFYCLAVKSYGQHEPRYADKFFREAASWGSKPAEYVLGVMALNGDGQSPDRPLALAWFALASERHTQRFQQPYDDLKKQLAPAELAKADAYLDTMKRTYGDQVAGARAEQRYRDGMKRLAPSANEGVYCMEGMREYATSDDSAAIGGTAGASTKGCGTMVQVQQYVDREASDLFEDYAGHVSVGPITAVPGTSSHTP